MSTVVSGTLVDAKGQLWVNAPIQFIFQPTYGVPGPYTWSGGVLNKMPPIVFTDATGHFSITLPANSEITPASSLWQCAIGPSATLPAVVLTLSLIPGTLNISSLFSTLAITGLAQSLFVPRAYSDAEVIVPPNSGQLYYDVVAKRLKFYEDGVWNPLAAAGSGMVYPGIGIAVSTGTAWGPSIDPARLAYLDQTNIFTNPIVTPSVISQTDLVLEAAGVTKLNWDAGLGVRIGDGASNTVVSIDPAGNVGALAYFWGKVATGTGKVFSNASATLFDSLGADNVTNGAILFRSAFADGSNFHELLRLNAQGNVQFSGTMGHINNSVALYDLGAFPSGPGYSAYGGDGTNLILNPKNAGSTYINFNGGATGSTNFGNGAGAVVATIDTAGNADFKGRLHVNANISAGFQVQPEGFTVGWNLSSGLGETDFINSNGSVNGGFRWFNVAASSTINSGTVSNMWLDNGSNLNVLGNINAGNIFNGKSLHLSNVNLDNAIVQLSTNAPDAKWSVEVVDQSQRYRCVAANDSADYVYMVVTRNVGSHIVTGVNIATNFTVTNGAKSFKVEHPLDDTRDLYHSCLEGPENGVYYRGEVVTQEGSATVILPAYFEALTYWEDRSVLVSQIFEEEDELLCLVAAGRIKDGRFRIRTSAPSAKVAWEVTAVRKLGVGRLEVEPLRSNT